MYDCDMKSENEKFSELNVTSLFMIYNCCMALFPLVCNAMCSQRKGDKINPDVNFAFIIHLCLLAFTPPTFHFFYFLLSVHKELCMNILKLDYLHSLSLQYNCKTAVDSLIEIKMIHCERGMTSNNKIVRSILQR